MAVRKKKKKKVAKKVAEEPTKRKKKVRKSSKVKRRKKYTNEPTGVLDKKITRKILEAAEQGHYRRTMAALARIPYQTLKKWVNKGKKGQEPFATFYQDLREAEEKSIAECIASWRTHFKRDWRASAEFAARRRPKQWSKDRGEEGDSKTVKVPLKLSLVDDEPDPDKGGNGRG